MTKLPQIINFVKKTFLRKVGFFGGNFKKDFP